MGRSLLLFVRLRIAIKFLIILKLFIARSVGQNRTTGKIKRLETDSYNVNKASLLSDLQMAKVEKNEDKMKEIVIGAGGVMAAAGMVF